MVRDVLARAGHELEPVDMSVIATASAATRIIVASEALVRYREHLDTLERIGDPRVLSRIRAAESFSTRQLDDAYATRADAVALFGRLLSGFDALVSPTVAIDTPTIADATERFDDVNAMMLRNCALINLVDGAAVSLPFRHDPSPGRTGALMVAGARDSDDRVIAVARILDAILPRLPATVAG